MLESKAKRTPNGGALTAHPEASTHYTDWDKLLELCLDKGTMMYSCGLFARGAKTLEEAQIAKIDDALDALDLHPGEHVLEIGCGWGATAQRLRQRYNLDLVALTLSQSHVDSTKKLTENDEHLDVRLEGWEEYRPQQLLDKILAIASFEHVMRARFELYFARCREMIKHEGLMFTETITLGKKPDNRRNFYQHWLLMKKLFPGSEIPYPDELIQHARQNGFETLKVEGRRQDYALTLNTWADNLERNRDAAISITGEETYTQFMEYFRKSAYYFNNGELGVHYYLMRAIN